ncbi:hypothetical protein EDD16DRAFT_1524021 [Pisolithus croceorrhizus]|nr:hypothetical protein EDD16DRAFT_1524021 [Pisolithus croceorrhizus]
MPCYLPVQGFMDPDIPACTYKYSNKADSLPYAVPHFVCPTCMITTTTYSSSTRVRISQAEDATLIQELNLPNVIEPNFLPHGTYLTTWECPVPHLLVPRPSKPIAHKSNGMILTPRYFISKLDITWPDSQFSQKGPPLARTGQTGF